MSERGERENGKAKPEGGNSLTLSPSLLQKRHNFYFFEGHLIDDLQTSHPSSISSSSSSVNLPKVRLTYSAVVLAMAPSNVDK